MKIRCSVPWNAERDIGYIRPEGMSVEEHNRIEARRLAQEHPDLRPCGRLHLVVEKTSCVRTKCRYLLEVINE